MRTIAEQFTILLDLSEWFLIFLILRASSVFLACFVDNNLSEIQLAAEQIVNHRRRNAGRCRKVVDTQRAAACENTNISSHFLLWILDVASV
jgi:hypothetical protein